MIETFSVLSRGHLSRYLKHHGLRYIDGRQVPFRQHLHECRMAKVARVLLDLSAQLQWPPNQTRKVSQPDRDMSRNQMLPRAGRFSLPACVRFSLLAIASEDRSVHAFQRKTPALCTYFKVLWLFIVICMYFVHTLCTFAKLFKPFGIKLDFV